MPNNTLEHGLTRYFTPEQLAKIRNAKVFIAGCGGLGSNIAHMLVRCGFRHLALLDCDQLDASNLNRQFFFPDQVGRNKAEALAETLLRLNPKLCLRTLVQRVENAAEVPALTQHDDILVEAFDGPQSKAAFVSGAVQTRKPVVCATGIAGYGNTDAIVTRRMGENLYVVGDGQTGIDQCPPLAPRVMVAAAKQADLVLQLVLEGAPLDV